MVRSRILSLVLLLTTSLTSALSPHEVKSSGFKVNEGQVPVNRSASTAGVEEQLDAVQRKLELESLLQEACREFSPTQADKTAECVANVLSVVDIDQEAGVPPAMGLLQTLVTVKKELLASISQLVGIEGVELDDVKDLVDKHAGVLLADYVDMEFTMRKLKELHDAQVEFAEKIVENRALSGKDTINLLFNNLLIAITGGRPIYKIPEDAVNQHADVMPTYSHVAAPIPLLSGNSYPTVYFTDPKKTVNDFAKSVQEKEFNPVFVNPSPIFSGVEQPFRKPTAFLARTASGHGLEAPVGSVPLNQAQVDEYLKALETVRAMQGMLAL